MTVELTPQIEEFIREMVRSGKYRNALEVVSESLQLLDARDRRERLISAIAIGDEQISRGESTPWTSESINEILAEADEEDRRGLPIADDVQP